MANRPSLAKEFWAFMWQRKAFWITPIIIVLLLLAILVMAGGSSVAPFVYTLF